MSEYSKDISIDKYALDDELQKQAILFMKYAEMAAEAILVRDKAKERLAVVMAEVDAEIRGNPDEYGFDKKPTESAISNCIVRDERYSKANHDLIEANKDMNILTSAKEAMAHKKKSLEKLVDLFLAGYWSDDIIRKEVKKVDGEVKAPTSIIKKRRMK